MRPTADTKAIIKHRNSCKAIVFTAVRPPSSSTMLRLQETMGGRLCDAVVRHTPAADMCPTAVSKTAQAPFRGLTFLARDRHRRDQLAGSPLPRSVGASSSAMCRYCCKKLFAVVIKNFPRFRRDFHVKMWGTSSSDDKLADDLGNAIEGHTNLRSSARFFYSRKLAPAN